MGFTIFFNIIACLDPQSAFQAREMAVAQVKLAVRAMGVKGKYLEVSAEKLLKYLEAEKSTHFLTEILTFPAGVKHQVTYGTHPSWRFASHHPPTNLWGLADVQPETTGAFGHYRPHSYANY